MKTIKQGLIVVALALVLPFASCVDKLRFGDGFLEKAPGGTVVKDSVFINAEYTRQFLTGIYALQYYGFPYSNGDSDFPYRYSRWNGKWEPLSDIYSTSWNGMSANAHYYTGTLTSGYARNQGIWDYLRFNVWEAVAAGYTFLENIEGVPGMDAAEKARLSAEAKCLIASRYWDMFRHYGGVPVVKATFSGDEPVYELPRATVEETVDFMVDLLDQAAPALPWQVENPATEAGRWTRAGAMGLKTSILLFAASPLFNSAEPYAPGPAADQHLVWYGGYREDLWSRALTACEQFFTELSANGQYSLVQAAGTRPQDYRLAFRKGYFTLTSTEVLHSTRVTTYDNHNSGTYSWYQLYLSNNRGYNPTQEYMEMFPWADGTPFDWDREETAGTLDRMFTERVADPTTGVTLTRDPRLYESIGVNGVPKQLDWATGNMSGNIMEGFVGGKDAANKPVMQDQMWSTGYVNLKYILSLESGADHMRQDVHWCYLRLPEIMFNYAEALCHAGRLSEAIDIVDDIRARVGLGGLVASNPDKNLTGDAEALLAEILRERACELGMEDVRFFDMKRYKMADRFAAPLHMLLITRQDGKTNAPWIGEEKDAGKPWPEFNYEVRPITGMHARVWWTQGFDPKWYLQPFPLGELNKNYGLVQNPGW